MTLKIKDIPHGDVKQIIEDLPEDAEYTFEEYKTWFFETFGFSDKTVDDYSAIAHASKDLNEDIQEKIVELKEAFGKRGDVAGEQVSDVYEFIETDQFLEACNGVFNEAAEEGSDELGFADFEDAIEAFLTDILICTKDIGDDEGTVSVKKEDVKNIFDQVDEDESGTINRGEFAALMKFCCLHFKMDSLSDFKELLEKTPAYTDFNETFRMGGNTFLDKDLGRFTLVRGKHQRAIGHFLCRMPFDADGDTYVKLDYQCNPREDAVWEEDKKAANEKCGEGLCVYLVDPEAEGWDEQFDGEGPCGFQGKPGGIFGVFLDLGGNIGEKNAVVVKSCDPEADVIASELYSKGMGLRTKQNDAKWRKLEVHFNTDDKKVSVKVGGKTVLETEVAIEIPKKICVGVCAGTSKTASSRFSVNNLRFENDPDDDEDDSSDEE
eukprot:TRINITY_DN14434_c0_g1_i9.p1 TRINITY_DN14434_c0_g1~~TRINITY_DN14434_c0_g1_i9.p1  ORF type:complete len:436 (+),score=154.71 TRINITY_DN14434_c0_g1_i9:239-1546(+)